MDPGDRFFRPEQPNDAAPSDEAMPGVGAPPRPGATGDDSGDAGRRAAGADPAAAAYETENPLSPSTFLRPD